MTAQTSEFLSVTPPWLGELTWKSSLILLAALIAGWLVRKRWPLAVSTMWNATLVALVILPLTTLAPAWQVDLWSDPPAQPVAGSIRKEPPRGEQPVREDSLGDNLVHPQIAVPAGGSPAPMAKVLSEGNHSSSAVLATSQWPTLLAFIVVAGMALSSWRWGMGQLQLRRLVRSAAPVREVEWVAGLSRWRSELRIFGSVQLLHSTEVRIPFTCGIFSPAILIPSDLVGKSGCEERDVILIHELTHIARQDCGWQSLLRLTQVIYWWQPLLWLAAGQVAEVRERACDQFAIGRLNSRQQYLNVLLRLAERIVQPLQLGVGLAIIRVPRLKSRLEDICVGKTLDRCRSPRRSSLFLGTGCLVIAAALGAGIAELRSAPPVGAKVDQYGDDLPPGAIARLGSSRLQHGDRVDELRYSHDGSLLITCSEGGLFIWNAADGKLVRRLDVRGLFRLWGPDNQLLLGKSETDVLQPWNLSDAAGPPVEAIPPDNRIRAIGLPPPDQDNERIAHFTPSPDGHFLATATQGRLDLPRRIQLRQVEPGKAIADWDRLAHEWTSQSAVQQLIFSQDSRHVLVLASEFGGGTPASNSRPKPDEPEKTFRVMVCNLVDGSWAVPIQIPEPASFNSKALAISPSGDRIAVGRRNSEVLIYHPGKSEPVSNLVVPQPNPDRTDPASVLQFSPDGSLLAGSGRAGEVWLWDLRTGKLKWQLSGHHSVVEKLVFSPDGQTLATGAQDHRVLRWDVATGERLDREVSHEFRVFGVSLSRSGQLAATSGWDGNLRIWKPLTGELAAIHRSSGEANLFNCEFSPAEDLIAMTESEAVAGVYSGRVAVLEVASGKRLWEQKIEAPGGVNRNLSFSADGQRLAGRSGTHNVTIWNARTGEPLANFIVRNASVTAGDPAAAPLPRLVDEDATREVCALGLSPDGRRLAIGTKNNYAGSGRLEIVDVESGVHQQSIDLPKSTTNRIRFSPDGRTLVTAGSSSLQGARVPDNLDLSSPGYEDSLAVWDVETGTVIRKFGVVGTQEQGSRFSHDAVFSADGRFLVTAEHSKNVLIYEVVTGKQLRIVKGHLGPVMALALSTDGRTLISGSVDNTALVWDFASLCVPEAP